MFQIYMYQFKQIQGFTFWNVLGKNDKLPLSISLFYTTGTYLNIMKRHMLIINWFLNILNAFSLVLNLVWNLFVLKLWWSLYLLAFKLRMSFKVSVLREEKYWNMAGLKSNEKPFLKFPSRKNRLCFEFIFQVGSISSAFNS